MFNNNLLMGAASASGESLVSVGNSALFDSANSEYLSRTPSSAGNRDTWTISYWVYKTYISGAKAFFTAGSDNTNVTELRDQGTGILEYRHQDGGSITDNIITTAIFRDIGWYHIVWAVDTTQAVESSRIILYVNGERITDFSTANYPAQNADTDVNATVPTNIGARTGPDQYWSGYMAEAVLIDGLQLTPTSFGQYDSTGTFWTPKSSAVIQELTFGTNGFYLANKVTDQPQLDFQAGDANTLADSQIKSLLHFDGSDASTTFTDSSSYGPTWTAAGNAQLDTAQKKFGTASLLLDGTGDSISTPSLGLPGTDPFTIDMWVRRNGANTNNGIFSFGVNSGGTSNQQIRLLTSTDNKLIISTNNAAVIGTSDHSTSLPDGEFAHVAVTRSGNTIYLFQNGTLLASASFSYNLIDPNPYYIGNDIGAANNFNGHVDEFRVILGECKYTANFSVETSAYSNPPTANNLTNYNTVTTNTHTPTNIELLVSPIAQAGTANLPVTSNGNRTVTAASTTQVRVATNLPFPASGKWLAGVSQTEINVTGTSFGVWTDRSVSVKMPGGGEGFAGFHQTSGMYMYPTGRTAILASALTITTSDSFWVAVDVDAGKIFLGHYDESADTITWYAADGGTDGNPATGDNPTQASLTLAGTTYAFAMQNNKAMTLIKEADIPYAIPTGYEFLNSTTLAANITRTKSNLEEYFDSTLYEGNGAGQRVGKFLPFTDSFVVGNGALFDYANNEILKRTNSSGGNETKWTFSTWVKFNNFDAAQIIFGSNAPTISPALWISSNDLYFTLYNGDFAAGGGSYVMNLITDIKLYDTSQWMNIVAKYDSTPSTPSASSIALYLNGVQITNFSTESYPSQNQVAGWNSANEMIIGTAYNNHLTTQNLRAYLAETVNIDGLALEPSSFGQVDTSTGRWIPKDVSGLTFGTNGFYLNYANSSDVGNDVSGNNNDWTNVNTVTQVGDTPTVNSNVWNPSESAFSGGTFTNGNRTVQTGTSQYAPAQAGLPISSGKWYTEVVPTATSNIASFQIGITKGLTTANTQQLGSLVNDVGYSGQAGNLFYNGESGSGGQSYGASYAVDDVIGMAIDFDANTITFYKNGASQGVITLPDTSTASTPYFIACNHYDNSSNGTFLLRSLSSDWTGTAPTDHLAIIQDNMPAGESYQTAWSWIKNRDATDNHMLFDRVRGIYNDLHSNTSDTEVTNVNTLQRFLNGGVQVGNDVQVNTVNESYVAWNWYMEATGSGSALTSGSINTTALVDTNLGLSVGTYTGSGSAGTIETGLTNTQFIIVKRRNSAANWPCWHVGLPDDNNLYLDVTNAKSADGLYDTSSNTSTLIAFAGSGGAVNASGGTYSFVAFAPSQFTAIGSYTGNGNANGTFVPTVNSLGIPIQPAWVMIKRTDAANSWQLTDTVRTPDNPSSLILQAQLSNAELDNSDLDIVTGGFKLRATDNIFNNSSGTYVYLAFGTPIIDVDGRIIGGR